MKTFPQTKEEVRMQNGENDLRMRTKEKSECHKRENFHFFLLHSSFCLARKTLTESYSTRDYP